MADDLAKRPAKSPPNFIPLSFEEAVDGLLNSRPKKKPPSPQPPSKKKRQPKTK